MRTGSTPLPAAVSAFAGRRHGIVDDAELQTLGLSAFQIGRWARLGRLHRLHPTVYTVIPPALLTIEARWLAAVKACGPGSFLSHGPAGQLAGIVPRNHRYAIDVSVLERRRIRLPGIVVHRSRNFEARDTTTRFWIPTTTPTRVVWDMASTHPRRLVRRAFEQAEKFDRLDRGRLATLAAASSNRKGAGLIRRLLVDRIVPLSEVRSWLEELLLTICVDHSMPFPAVNVPLLDYEVDFLWEPARFVVEADGGEHLKPGLRDKDNERDFVLQRAGYLVRRYSSRDMGRESNVVREVLGILRERAG